MLPRVILHNAVSADGRNDGFIPDIGLFYKLASRWKEDATLVGSNTILKAVDEIPKETKADLESYEAELDNSRPLLIVPDSKGRIKIWHFLRKQPYWSDIIVLCSKTTPKKYLDYLKKRHIKFIIAGKEKVNLRFALEKLNSEYKVKVVRVDSGGTLNGVLLRMGLVDEISILIHPYLVGGTKAHSIFRTPELTSSKRVIKCNLIHFEKLKKGIIWLIYKVIK